MNFRISNILFVSGTTSPAFAVNVLTSCSSISSGCFSTRATFFSTIFFIDIGATISSTSGFSNFCI